MDEGGGAEAFMEEASNTPASEDVPSSLYFEGSIANAIVRAQTEKKILIVFVAGEDDESVLLENTTFQQSEVVNEVQRQSLVLRMQEGSTDVAYFSAIYPLQRVPTITLLGLQGSMLHQLVGYRSGEEFLVTLHQAVATFDSQVAAETWIKICNVGTSESYSDDQEEDTYQVLQQYGRKLRRTAAASAMVALLSSANMSPASTVTPPHLLPAADSTDPSVQVQSSQLPETQLPTSQVGRVPSSQFENTSQGNNAEANTQLPQGPGSSPSAEPLLVPHSDQPRSECSLLGEPLERPEGTSAIKSETQNSRVGGLGNAYTEARAGVRQGSDKKSILRRESSGAKEVPVRTGPFLLQIRLTNGKTICGTFESSQLLRDVKQFVDIQRTDGNVKYCLAVPFPRKMFSEEDLDKTLKKLDLGPRSALILVPSSSVIEDGTRSQASAYQAPSNPSQSSTPAAGGSYVGRILSYLNPFAYGKGGASADQQSPSNTPWQYDANPAMARALREGLQPPVPSSSQPQPSFTTPYNSGSNQKGDTGQTGNLSQRKGWGVGGNVHTLHQDDNEPSPRANTYWNGNSTQYGGDDEAKED